MGNPNPSYGLAFPIKREAAEVEASRPRIRCERCDGADFDDGEDGFFYCRDCGGLSQDMLDTACADEDLFAVGSLYSTKHVRHSQSQPQALPQDKAAEEDVLRSLARDPDGRVREEEGPQEFEEGAYQPMDFGSAPCPDDKAMADGIRARYVQGLQLMIQMQCKELVEGFGVSHLICGVAGTVWLRYLAAIRVFDESWADKAIWESEGAARERYEKKEEHNMHRIDRSEPHTFSRRKPIYIWASSLRKMIPVHSSLAIAFLACHIVREPILPTDLVKWALEGKLPYISAFVDIDKSLGKPSATCSLSSRFLFRPIHSVGTWQLEATAGSIAQCIGLHLPPVNFYAVAQRYLKQLSLPLGKVLPHTCRIYEWSMPAELWLSANAFRLPTRVCVMSILIIAIRILYNIHGHGIWEMSLSHLHNSSPSNKKSQSSLDSGVLNSLQNCHEKECHSTCSHEPKIDKTPDEDLTHTQASPFDTMELLCNLEAKYGEIVNTLDYSKGLGSYLKYCKDVVFAGITTSYDEEKLIESLWDIYEKQEDDDIMTKETGLCNRNRSSDEDNVLMEGKIQRGVEGGKIRRVDVLMNNSSIAHNSHDTRHDDGYADRISEGWMLDNSCVDNAQSDGKHIVTGSSRMDDAKDVEGSRTDGAKHAALTRLKLNMDENGFEYLPPRARRRTGDYLHYRRKKIRGKFHYVAHADYYILLRACAKLAQVDVRIMHLGVLKLERRLSWIEQRISGSLMLFRNECERTSEENKTTHY